MKPIIFTILMLTLPILAQGQEKEYPYPLKPGERFRGSAEVDSLFATYTNGIKVGSDFVVLLAPLYFG